MQGIFTEIVGGEGVDGICSQIRGAQILDNLVFVLKKWRKKWPLTSSSGVSVSEVTENLTVDKLSEHVLIT